MKLRALGLLLLCGLLSSCNLAANAAASRFGVRLEPDSVAIAPGESGEVVVTLRPLTGIEFKPGEATVTLNRPPEGVSAQPVAIPSGLDATLVIEVAEDATLTAEDEPLELEVRAVKDGIGAKATLELTIALTDEFDED